MTKKRFLYSRMNRVNPHDSTVLKTVCKQLFLLASMYAHAAFAVVNNTDSSSSDVLPAVKRANAILTLKSGFMTTPSSVLVITNAVCPTGFTPYVTVSLNQAMTDDSDDALLHSKKACVISATSASPNTNVSLSVSGVSNEYTKTSGGLHISTSDGTWDVWHTEDMPDNYNFNATQGTATLGQLYWVLYCYPQGTSHPPYICP